MCTFVRVQYSYIICMPPPPEDITAPYKPLLGTRALTNESRTGSVRISACVIRVDMSLIRGKYDNHHIRLCNFRYHGYRVHDPSSSKMYV